MAYVYQHIRLDSNKVFYIGIGLDNEGKYRRAKCKGNRNRYWLNIVNKHGYTVEILLDGLTWEDALLKEVEYIKMFGRKQFGGSLINLTDGGDGNTGYVTSDETKKKQSQLKKGWKPPHSWKMFTPEARAKRAKTVAARVASNYYVSWNKGKKTKPETIEKWKDKMRGRPSNAKGKKWSDEKKLATSLLRMSANINNNKHNVSKKYKEDHKQIKGVLQLDLLGNVVAEHYSLRQAANSVGCNRATIYKACKNPEMISCAFRWEYKN